MCWIDHTKTAGPSRISADGEDSAAEAASLFAGFKGKHCAQHVFLMKASVQRRTAAPHRRASETNRE